MPPPDKTVRPIYVIKKKISHGGHHGGAWKVAYADFVTAMMSLFIVLWLLNSTPQVQKAIAGYFNDPRSSGKQTGTMNLGAGESVSIDKKNVEKLKEEIEKAILKQSDLTKLAKQIEITVTSEGLKIELIEDKGGTFFQSGSPKLSDSGVELLNLLSAQLKVLPNRLLIEGHTDAQPFSSDALYTNWELSSDRANSARRLLQQDGVGPTQISQVRGYADQMLRVPANPLDPSNRRISLIVQWVDAASAPPGAILPAPAVGTAASPGSGAGPGATQNVAANGDAKSAAEAAPATPASATSASAAPPSATAAPAVQKPAVVPLTAISKPTWIARIRSLVPGKKK
jgi:chemotaxis protein MotB